MFGLFIALFGGIWLIAKCSSENNASKRFNAHADEWSRAKDRWVKSVTDKELEKKIEQYVYENPLEAAAKAKAICGGIIPEDQCDSKNYRRILMSEYGKLLSMDAHFGIDSPLYGPPEFMREKKYKEFYDFVIWLKGNLELHGMEPGDLYFEPNWPGSNEEKHCKVCGPQIKCGSYEWKYQDIVVYLRENKQGA